MTGYPHLAAMGLAHDCRNFLVTKGKLPGGVGWINRFAIDKNLDDIDPIPPLFTHGLAQSPWAIRDMA